LRHLRALGERFYIAEALEQAGRCSLLEQRSERAAMLLAAAEALRNELGAPLRARASEAHARDVAQARAELGDATFAAAWYAGQRLPFEAAIDLVLADVSPATPATVPLKPADSPADMPLTRRERELAVLVARGLTNREIAEQLVIAEGTTERHLANIFSKLGLSSRARLAAWAVERGLVPAEA
jgi:non-specific serine/threonine protein kinase